jgi:hypothetical protein
MNPDMARFASASSFKGERRVQAGTPYAGKYENGVAYDLPGGGFVGFREVSSAGGPPTIDLNLPGVGVFKLKFTG